MTTPLQRALMIATFSVAELLSTRYGNAEITTTIEVRESYEDNAIGLVADNQNVTGPVDNRGGGAGKPAAAISRQGGADDNMPGGSVGGGQRGPKADFSTSIHADVLSRTALGGSTAFLAQAGGEYTAYNTYSQFDFTILSLRAGISQGLTDDITLRMLAKGAMKWYSNSQRDSTAYGAIVSLREKINPQFRLRQIYEYEQNRANSTLYNYDGNSIGFWAGFFATEQSLIDIGYSYLSRAYQGPGGVTVTTQTLSFYWSLDFDEHWSVNVGYDRDLVKDNLVNASLTNNIYSIGLQASY